MKILMINVTCGVGSTGRICTDLAEALEQRGHTVKIAYGRGEIQQKHQKYAVKIGNDYDTYVHYCKSCFFDKMGFGSIHATRKFIEWIQIYNPDVIHLHNLHGYYLNVDELFSFLKKSDIKIIWTLHDCWTFTGHCAFFDFNKCEKWKKCCERCNHRSEYPFRLGLDNSKNNYLIKKKLFTQIDNLILVTPSQWLADNVKASFLQQYPVKVIRNGVNLKVFHPVKTNIRNRNNISMNKRVVLGIASVWDKRKGLEDFIKLNTLLSDDYQIVLIGLNKHQLKMLPSGIIGIERTENVNELVEWYSTADVFVNMTYEDNYPTTNIESIACGTPVITYDTGGSSESAMYYGNVAKEKNPKEVAWLIENEKYYKKDCIDLSSEKMLNEYIKLYDEEYERMLK